MADLEKYKDGYQEINNLIKIFLNQSLSLYQHMKMLGR